MELKQIVEKRRAYRSLDHVLISEDFIEDLAQYAQLSPSCFNSQPWRFVFVYDKEKLGDVFEALPKGNVWAKEASLIIAVASTQAYDCQIKGRNYYLFDTGMATAYIILRATELGYVAHPIAGFDEAKIKSILGVPNDLTVITLVIVGKHSRTISPVLSEKQTETEKKRPERLPLGKFAFKNHFVEGSEKTV
jgi:nitroreductase